MLRSFQADFCILAIYAYMLATPTRWEGLMWTALIRIPKVTRIQSKTKIQCKSRVFNARCCTKLKKEVSDDLFVSSCRACLIAAGPCHGWLCSYMAELFMPYLCRYSVLEATKQIFVTLGNYFGSYRRLVSCATWLVFVMDSSLLCGPGYSEDRRYVA